uniref:Uncharacterized protein n=1 Tax=Melopsittacus undulatus TaxID=13146 RepID=A0A8C6NDM1_MELUD
STMEACLRALEALISPSAATTSLVSRAASASAPMALCMTTGILMSLISTRATVIPHCSVALKIDGILKHKPTHFCTLCCYKRR